MPIPMPPTPPIDLDALGAFLISDRAPEGSMGLSDLDGLLTGVVVGPELIMPSEWTRAIWGGEGPDFDSMEEALAIHGTITGESIQTCGVWSGSGRTPAHGGGRGRCRSWCGGSGWSRSCSPG